MRCLKKSIYLFFIKSLVIALVSCAPSHEKNTANAPNLLFIFPDQFRNAAVGINKQDPVYTPHINQLAKEGMLISNAISNFPLCSPYRAMLMTGVLPYRNSVLSNANSNRYKYNNSWQKSDISFSDVLVKNGYDAGYVGKLHLTSPPPIADKDTVIWDAYTPKEERHGFNFWYSYGTFDQHNKPHYWINDAKEEEVFEVNEWSPKHEADVIIDYIKNKGQNTRDDSKPFALFWSVNPPHPPYQYVPENYLEAYKNKPLKELLLRKNVNLKGKTDALAFHNGATRNRTALAEKHVRDYFAMITGVDEQIGRVIKTLEEQGLADNTIVVITSDHGEMMGSHGLMSKNVWYEEAINVPFIIKWPKKIAAGQKKDYLISVTDIMPTLLNMLGATDGIPLNLDGQDLSSLILNGQGQKPDTALYYYIEEGKPASGHRGIRTKTHTYVVTIDDNDQVRTLLFDNIKDPWQLYNLADQQKDIENTLKKQLFQSLKKKKDPWLLHYKQVSQS